MFSLSFVNPFDSCQLCCSIFVVCLDFFCLCFLLFALSLCFLLPASVPFSLRPCLFFFLPHAQCLRPQHPQRCLEALLFFIRTHDADRRAARILSPGLHFSSFPRSADLIIMQEQKGSFGVNNTRSRGAQKNQQHLPQNFNISSHNMQSPCPHFHSCQSPFSTDFSGRLPYKPSPVSSTCFLIHVISNYRTDYSCAAPPGSSPLRSPKPGFSSLLSGEDLQEVWGIWHMIANFPQSNYY